MPRRSPARRRAWADVKDEVDQAVVAAAGPSGGPSGFVTGSGTVGGLMRWVGATAAGDNAGIVGTDFAAQPAHVVLIGPAAGADAVPTKRLMVAADIPALAYDASGLAAAVAGDLSTHAGLSTTAHGGIVASSDARLSDARPASDVYAWAKASAKPSYAYSEVGADPSGAAAAVTPTTLGLVIGTNTQAYSAKLTAVAALANAAGWLHNDGSGAYAYSTPGYADVGAQPVSAKLTTIAGLSDADSNIIVGSAGGWVAESGATARTSLGLGTTDAVYFAIGSGIGTAGNANSSLRVGGTLTGATATHAIVLAGTYTTVGASAYGIRDLSTYIITANNDGIYDYLNGIAIAAGAFTGVTYQGVHIQQPTMASGALATSYAFYVSSGAGAMNYSFYGQTGKFYNEDAAGFGVSSPTAVVHLKAGTATANTAPFKFTSGTNLTTAEAGALEYDGTNLFFTRAGTVREYVSVAVAGVAAPTPTAGVLITNYYGTSATNFLGTPDAWESVNYGGTVYKRALYL